MDSIKRAATSESIALDDFPLTEERRGYELIKRMQDVSMAIIALLLLSPLWLLIGLVIRLTSDGPAIHRQKNVIGRYGRPFTLYKFRTMYVNIDDAQHREAIARFVEGKALDVIEKDGKEVPVYKLTRDPRVTPVGRFLRKTGLDEIPQLINVLRGELALVGPRPPLDYEYERYTNRHKRRLEVLPGITGLYQVTARSQVPFERMIEIDLDYVQRRSYWFDLKIMLLTPWVLITGKGAY
jgi:lipopolysaccharide/colanic/teichoic acid biosynthesis glycosyltransferase